MIGEKLILWADDDPDDHLLVRECLQELETDFTLLELPDGLQVLEYLEQAQPEQLPGLIVLDINMPGMNGKEVAKTIMEDNHLKDIPVVLYTTAKNKRDEQFCKQYGLKLIYKPWSFADTVKAIKGILDIYTCPQH